MTQISIPKELADHAEKMARTVMDDLRIKQFQYGENDFACAINREDMVKVLKAMFVQGWLDWTLAQSVLRKP